MKNLLGLKAAGDVHDAFLVRFWLTMTQQGGSVHVLTLAVGGAAVVLVLILRRIKQALGWPLLPDLLLTVVALASATAWLGLEAQGVNVVGEIPAKLPSFSVPDFAAVDLRPLSTSALAIATLGL